MRTRRDIARAFCSHRFAEAYDSLAPDVHWVSRGGTTIEGHRAVIETCEGTLRELADTTTEFLSFVVIDGGDTVAVDAVGRYVDAAGAASVVAIVRHLRVRGGLVHQITSYTVEIDPVAAPAS